MTNEISLLEELNKKMDKLNANIERLIGIIVIQGSSEKTKQEYTLPKQAGNLTMDIAAEVRAKIQAARTQAEASATQFKNQTDSVKND